MLLPTQLLSPRSLGCLMTATAHQLSGEATQRNRATTLDARCLRTLQRSQRLRVGQMRLASKRRVGAIKMQLCLPSHSSALSGSDLTVMDEVRTSAGGKVATKLMRRAIWLGQCGRVASQPKHCAGQQPG